MPLAGATMPPPPLVTASSPNDPVPVRTRTSTTTTTTTITTTDRRRSRSQSRTRNRSRCPSSRNLLATESHKDGSKESGSGVTRTPECPQPLPPRGGPSASTPPPREKDDDEKKRTANEPPSDQPKTTRERGRGGGRFLPSWLGGGAGTGGTGVDKSGAVHPTRSSSRKRTRSRSLDASAADAALSPPDRPSRHPHRTRRPSEVEISTPHADRDDGVSFVESPSQQQRRRRPSSTKMSLRRFGRGRTRSKSPSASTTRPKAPEEAAPPPPPPSADADPSQRRSSSKVERRQQQPIDLDDDESHVDLDDEESGGAHRPEIVGASGSSLSESIYARAEAAQKQQDEGLGFASTNGNNEGDNGVILSNGRQSNAADNNDCRESTASPLPSPTIEPVRSLKDLRRRIEYAQSQQWVRGKGASLAEIRETLGLGQLRRRSDHLDATSSTDKSLADHALPLYHKLVQNIQAKGDDSPYVQYVLNSSSCEPEPAIMVFQFLHYLDVLVSAEPKPADRDPTLPSSTEPTQLAQLADQVAKMPTLACWCREILRYPDEFPDPLLEGCLAHLQRFPNILDPAERRQHILCILFRGSKDRSALDELRNDLERVVNRTGRVNLCDIDTTKENFDNKAGFLTLARAMFLYNSVERAVGANRPATKKRQGAARDKMEPFRAALDRHRNQVPESLVKVLERELLPPCAGPRCFRRGIVRCCTTASYCSVQCRDRGWKSHRNGCTYGNKIELAFPKAAAAPPDDSHRCSPLNGQRTEENVAQLELLESPQRRVKTESDNELKKAMAALKTPKTPKVQLDVIDMFDELRFVPLVSQKSSTDWLLRQDTWLREHPDFDYFVARPWGKMGIQFASDKAREEFRELRRQAPHNVDDVEEMLEVLARHCPEFKPSVTRQLEREYAMDLSKAAESPTKTSGSTTSGLLLPNCERPKKPLITPSPPPKRRVKPSSSSSPHSIDSSCEYRNRPWSIVAL